jgi:hypothetical protein
MSPGLGRRSPSTPPRLPGTAGASRSSRTRAASMPSSMTTGPRRTTRPMHALPGSAPWNSSGVDQGPRPRGPARGRHRPVPSLPAIGAVAGTGRRRQGALPTSISRHPGAPVPGFGLAPGHPHSRPRAGCAWGQPNRADVHRRPKRGLALRLPVPGWGWQRSLRSRVQVRLRAATGTGRGSTAGRALRPSRTGDPDNGRAWPPCAQWL